jgi:predicted kinase
MGKLKILVGTALSGKTTWAKEYLKNNKNTYYVSRDSEREIMFGEYRMGSQKEEDIITEIVNNKVWTYLRLGDVILDNTHCRQEYLDAVINEFKYSYDVEVVVMPLLEKVELVKRNQKRFFETGKLIPENVLHKQMKDFSQLIIPDNIYNKGVKTDKRVITKKEYNTNLKDCVIFDLDGTISLMNGRNPFKGEDCLSDEVNTSVKLLLDSIPNHVEIFIFSGRSEENGARENTINWLSENSIPYSELIMRKEKDNRPDTVVKKEMFDNHIKGKYNVLFCVDDRDCVVKLWRDMGIDCFQVYYGNF